MNKEKIEKAKKIDNHIKITTDDLEYKFDYEKAYYNLSYNMYEIMVKNDRLKKENEKLKEKVEYLKEQKENKNKWFQLIADIGFDYDGCNTIESLKGLIDELIQYSLNGRNNDNFDTLMFEGDNNEL